jgi:hypothetical protein
MFGLSKPERWPMSAKDKLELSRHAKKRARQRGTKNEDLELVLEHGEFVKDVGGECSEISLKKDQIKELKAAGIAPGRAEKLCHLQLVVASDGTVVTVMKNAEFRQSSRRRNLTGRQRAINAMLYSRGRRRGR